VTHDHPSPRSTKTRRRGWTATRQARFDELIERYRFPRHSPPVIDVLDIGVGHGETTVASALHAPHLQHVAVELHVPGVARLLDAVERYQLTTVSVVVTDVVELLDTLGDACVGEARVLFPDPWPKARHHVRRLIRPDVVARFARVLRPGGVVHLATDHTEYAAWIQRVMSHSGVFTGGAVVRPHWRADSRYSVRAASAGRQVTDLRYELVGGGPSA
jgi:tRNA (guanine-N7-)-methyltransferase